MTRRHFLAGMNGAAAIRGAAAQSGRPPNIILLYADDLGCGDLSCYGASRVRTPNIDRLAAHGVRFTDAHSAAATCTPSRYSLLTGEYAFRNEKARILAGDAPALIRPGRFTLASLLSGRGYATGVIGKWHLGLGDGKLDWNGEIGPGPLDIGFHESFIIPATGDRVPCVYVENRRVHNLDPADPIRVSYSGPLDDQPTGRANPPSLKLAPSPGHDQTIVNGISRMGYMTGGQEALWKDEEMADVLTGRAISFIERHRSHPFFLYFATHDIHAPRAPHARFNGATPMGARGDAIVQLDSCAGKIIDTLGHLYLTYNTLVIVSSDNGGVAEEGYRDSGAELLGGHKPNGRFRGGKYSRFEGGTRVPLIVHWPARVKPGVSNALASQVDFTASLAALTGVPVPAGAAPDSENQLPALLGEARTGRKLLVEQAGSLSLREDAWKYIPPSPGPKVEPESKIELGASDAPQLYNLDLDPGETRNAAAQNALRVKAMAAALERIRQAPAATR
jgi:arylsulfatase A-like enzyme